MALNLSQLLGGAGVVAGSMRQAEEAERLARQNQLAIEEQNRLADLKARIAQQQFAQLQPTSEDAPSPPQFQFPGLMPQRQIAPAPPTPGLAQPMSREQAAFLEANVEYPPFQAASTRAARAVPTPSGVGRMAATSVSELPPGVERLGVAFEEARAAYRTAQAKLDRYGSRQRQADPAGYQQARMDAMRAEQAMKQAQQLYETAASPLLGAVQVQPRPPVPARTAPAPAAAPAPAGLALTANDAIARVLQREGGYVDDPADSGGKTRFGITEAVARRAGYQGDMRELPLDLAERIYRNEYWDAINADQLPANIRELAFDAAVNQGVGWTKGALAQAGNDPQRFMQLREARYRDIVAANPSQQKFLAGWMNRLQDLAGGVVGAMVPPAAAAGAPTARLTTPPASAAGTVSSAVAPEATLAPTAQNLANQVLNATGKLIQVDPTMLSRAMQDTQEFAARQRALLARQRNDVAQLAQLYMRSGTADGLRQGQQLMAAVGQADLGLMQFDQQMRETMVYMQGMQGLQEFAMGNNPSRLVGVWSYFSGAPVGVQMRDDGMFDLFFNGERVREGLSKDAVQSLAQQSMFQSARDTIAKSAALENELALKQKYGDARTNAMKDIWVALINQQGKLAEERAKAMQGKLTVDTNTGGAYLQLPEGVFFLTKSGVVELPGGAKIEPITAQRVPVPGR